MIYRWITVQSKSVPTHYTINFKLKILYLIIYSNCYKTKTFSVPTVNNCIETYIIVKRFSKISKLPSWVDMNGNDVAAVFASHHKARWRSGAAWSGSHSYLKRKKQQKERVRECKQSTPLYWKQMHSRSQLSKNVLSLSHSFCFSLIPKGFLVIKRSCDVFHSLRDAESLHVALATQH